MQKTPPPVSATFETLGYYEDVICADTGKILGTRTVTAENAAGRVFGQAGISDVFEVRELLILTRGHKTVGFDGSKKPLRIRTVLQILCGRLLVPINPIAA